jgi:type VII secretion effector (TIGR04197 family)
MSKEIKVDFNLVETKISELEGAIGGLTTNFPTTSSQNVLDVTNKLEEVIQSLTDLVSLYKEILNNDQTMLRQSVEQLKNTDQTIASSISTAGPTSGPRPISI